ncbi:glycoside hydrolase family 13 protein [Streptacidiphilus cavernicola]|uniref:Glycoside hydrolase family 13 protein n=1 Tax=Streptacidiphilus cavernicola TaxID=3342716 RepID=A0ABV6W0J4_9ACTN
MTSTNWWRSAVIYQVYIRSFADGNGDGVGDLAGVRAKLPYLSELGVDALWFNPWYASPMADAGYDVADYRRIDPLFGTLPQARELIGDAHRRGLRIIVDVVPNHVSEQHAWFQEALQSPPGSEARELFWFRPGRGADGELPPNDWNSEFGGGAWTRTTDPDGTPGEWYLHLFAAEQPDLNWTNPKVVEEYQSVLRFWFDLGVDGVRIDSATMPAKDPLLPDLGPEGSRPSSAQRPHPFIDRDEVHEIYRGWRALADSYPEPKALIGELWLDSPERLAAYLRQDELHTAFNFDYLNCPWDAARLRSVIDTTLRTHAPVDAPATWVLSNHDVTRHVTRYGRAESAQGRSPQQQGAPSDRGLGTRRARAALLLNLALPGSCYLYQGEELGLPEVYDIPDSARQDPYFHRTGGADTGRDGCRVPLPWSGTEAPYGFSPRGAGAEPWLPQPPVWAELSAAAQSGDAGSVLALYRRALRLRRDEPALGDGTMAWLDTPQQVLAFSRDDGFVCVVNLDSRPADLPAHREVLLTSGPLDEGRLPTDTAVWLRR